MQENVQIQSQMDPSLLTPNPWNSNIVSPDNERKLDAAIGRMGFFKPIIIRETSDGRLEILGGQHRWESACRLGLTSVPVFNVGKVDDKRAKEISLADNARYGADDAFSLSEIMRDIGDVGDIATFLPISASEIESLFVNDLNIDLDALDLSEEDADAEESQIEKPTKAPQTHTVMRFKVALADAERITQLIATTQKTHGYTKADDLTNAGDALVHLLLSSSVDEV